jgi:hypothetical protein
MAAVGADACLVVFLFPLTAGLAQADVFSMPAGQTGLETVSVGNPGNAADFRRFAVGYGSVAYSYQIGKYEVTAAQYTEFLNAVATTDTYSLYSPNMDATINSYGCNIKRDETQNGSERFTKIVLTRSTLRPHHKTHHKTGQNDLRKSF